MNCFKFQPRNFRHQLTEQEGCAPRQRLFEAPKCGIGIGTAIAIGGGLAAAGGIASSILSSNAQSDAAAQAARSQKKTNNLNYQMFQESRGSNGSAVLPLYLKNPDGTLFEGSLGKDLVSAYGQSALPLSTFQAATGKLSPSVQGATDLTNRIFGGGVTSEMQQNAAPVQAQRIATARSSSLDALHKTLDEIDAQQAQRGMVGDSYGNRLLQFQANKSAGDAIGAATLQNAQENADIKNYGDITLPLNNITLPFSQAQAQGNYAFMPNDQWLQSIGQRMQPLNMIKIGYQGPFQYQPLPTVGPGGTSAGAWAGALGSLSGSAGQGASAYMQMMQQQQLMQQINATNMANRAAANNFYPMAFNTASAMPAASAASVGGGTLGYGDGLYGGGVTNLF
jgi:hypothetical protein